MKEASEGHSKASVALVKHHEHIDLLGFAILSLTLHLELALL